MRHSTVVIVCASAALLAPATTFAQYVQQGTKLLASDAVGPTSRQGIGVALSADGTTAIVGGTEDNNFTGATWIWTRNGTTWTQQGAKLVGTGASGIACQGQSVAISADGNTAVVGGYCDGIGMGGSGPGAVWIFVRNGSTWTQQGSKLVGAGAIGPASQGVSVAVSADGNTALVGGYQDNVSVGAAWVFVRSGSTWTQQGPKLLGTGGVGTAQQGISVSLSADGNTALIGGPGDNIGAGAAWFFTRTGTTWTQQGAKVMATGAIGAPNFGNAVALSGDGLVAAVGGRTDNSLHGAVWMFSRNGSSWIQQGPKIAGAGSVGNGEQGFSVALSSNGAFMIEGAYKDNSSAGATWAYNRDGGVYAQLGPKLVGTGAVNPGNQGARIALSADGSTAIVGAFADNAAVGAVWIFTRALPPLPPHAAGDVDDDHKADMTLFKSNGNWTSLTSASGFGSSSTINWVAAGYRPVTGDYDGDGKQDPALYNPVTGNWLVAKSSTVYSSYLYVDFGGPGYTAVPGDYDGDGRTDIAVYNTTTGLWSILRSSTGYATAQNINWGGPGYTPVPGQDFDGDFISDIAVYRQSDGMWSILKSTTAFAIAFNVSWGGPGYWLVPGDYDGDRKADMGLYQPSTGAWSVLKSSTGYTTTITIAWGGAGYLPVPGDYDGDGKIDLGTYLPSTGTFYVLLSGTSYGSSLAIAAGGTAGDVVISTAIVSNANDTTRATDFDADGRAEMTIYNGTTGVWSSLTSSSNYVTAINRNWGGAGYQPVPGDYDGDGRTDLGLYQTTSGNWYVLLSGANFTTSLSKNSGGTGWVPVSGDYDGDGKTDLVVYNTTTGQWYGLKSGSNYTTTVNISFGGTGYVAVPGDFDGDGRSDIAVYQSATGVWSALLSTTNYTTSLSKNVGGAGYVPVQGDYDGDRKTDFVVYNTSTGVWYGLKSGSGYTTTINISWGGAGYAPIKGDYDGDGKTDLAAYVSSTGVWYILLSGANYTTTLSKSWGGAAYTAVPQYP